MDLAPFRNCKSTNVVSAAVRTLIAIVDDHISLNIDSPGTTVYFVIGITISRTVVIVNGEETMTGTGGGLMITDGKTGWLGITEFFNVVTDGIRIDPVGTYIPTIGDLIMIQDVIDRWLKRNEME